MQSEPALTEEQVHIVAKQTIALEEVLGCPQDVEWAFDEAGTWYALQTRPITTLPPDAFFDASVNGSSATLWDNSNIVESYSGITLPFTFSFANRAYRQVYIQFCEIMGVPQHMIDAHEVMFRNMLGSIRGHIYYNLVNWYRLVHMLPGMGHNASFMETMMGVRQGLTPEVASLFDFIKEPPRYSLWRRITVHATSLWRFMRMPAILKRFWKQFNRVYDASRKLDFDTMPLPALMQHYQHLNDSVLKQWHAPIINDYFCMLFFGLLKKLTQAWITDQAPEQVQGGSLQNDLLCGEGGLESTEPTKMLMRIAAAIDQGVPETRAWFLEHSPETIWEALDQHQKAPPLRASLQEFLDAYGFRCVNELKLEAPDLHDDPTFVLGAIAGYIRGGSYNIEAMEQRERAIREQAEQVVNGALSGTKKWIYNWVLKQTRTVVKNRENLRFARTKIFGIARHLFRAASKHLVSLHVLENEPDIFYLTVEEVLGYVEGRPSTTRLKDLVALRKKEFDDYRSTPPPPERFLTYGAAGASIAMPQVLADGNLIVNEGDETDPNRLTGTPCCPGVVEGVVRVVRSLEDAKGLDGEILVTERTDPGWVPLFPSCAGLLIERGSLLSHSAVVARELGIPTIVGVRGGLMQRLKSGQRVRMDAGSGVVEL